ncbi:MAG TPA: hypothetical protein VG841_09105 [Caulobacterales bacterium]|nr:hypothetical protein [Caulobacterales bacterium]
MKLFAVCIAALGVLASSALAQSDRAADWRADIDVARNEFLMKDRSYSAENRARADVLLQNLSARADRLNDAEIEAGLARAAALADNAHTRAYLLRNRGVWRRYPIRIWSFQGEWRVVAARPEHADLLGARLVRVAGARVASAQQLLRPLFAGNDNWARYMAGYSLTSPDALIGARLLHGDGKARFVFERDGRRIETELAPEPFVRRDVPEENWWFLSPAHAASAGWRHVLEGRALTPVLAGANESYRFVRCEGDVAYLQVNRASDAPSGETLGAFGERVLADLAARPPAHLIVDLRFNTGGDLTRGWALFEGLAASPLGQNRGRTLVLVGPNTFSAAITHVVQMRQFSHALLVGTPPGDGLETWSEGGNVLLPHSRINMHFADRAHTYSLRASGLPDDLVALDLNVDSLEPDRAADWGWDGYRAGRDAYAEAALGAPLVCPG